MNRTAIPVTVLLITCMVACKKNETATSINTPTAEENLTALQAISVGPSARYAGDSVYAVHTCMPKEQRNSIAFSTLPATVVEYLAEHYEGYVEVKAFSILDSSSVITGFIAVIKLDDLPIAVKFDADGNFVKVLEQKEGRDLGGKHGQQGKHDDKKQSKDTIALSALPEAISTYMTTNYSGDTLLYAFTKRDGDIVVISKNQGLYATSFDSSNTFLHHTMIRSNKGNLSPVTAADLPVPIINYLNDTYPGYSIEKSFLFTNHGSKNGYVVLITANNMKYGVLFDAEGNFVAARTFK